MERDGIERAHPPAGRRKRVAVAGGGTAGHVTSGLSIMLEFQKAYGADVYFIGCPGGFETQLIPARGFDLEMIPGAPFARQSIAGKMRAIATLVHGTHCARQLLKSRNTDLVIGLGGYASAGAVLAARTLGIHSVIHEANVFAGLANRLVARVVDRVFVGWEDTRGSFPRSDVVVTGNPVLPEIAATHPDAESHGGPRRILVTGGSQGSPFLNRNVPKMLRRVRELGIPLTVRHQTGAGETDLVRTLYQNAGIQASAEPFIQNMAQAYAEAHFVVAAAGALTLAELATLGLPSLLVPLQAAANQHQIANARAYTDDTGGAWVPEAEWQSESLSQRVATLLQDGAALHAQIARVRKRARPNAARDLVQACSELMH